ncbi:MAG: RHS repeat-associated core domain-containing protein [Putridiphycobacter sp.]
MKLKNLFAILIILRSLASFAGEERYMNYINGAAVVEGAILELNDAKFYMMQNLPYWQYQFTNHKVKNRVILEFDKNNPQEFTSDFTVNVQVTVDYIDENLVSHTEPRTLTLEYYANSQEIIIDRSSFVFEGAHQIEVTVGIITTPVGSLPPNLQLRTEIFVERYYAFDYNNLSSQLSYNYTTNDDYIEIFWNPIVGAEQYDLEWVYINDYTETIGAYESPTNLTFNYYKNSTRITTSNNSYKIPSIFDHGYVLFRVRGVGQHGTDFQQRYDGQWSAVESGNIANHPAGQVIPITSAYQGGQMNWTHSVVYTEEGKRKEQVVFMDGLGRQRQTVSYNPVTEQSIVQNAYYDYHGRIAVTDLPTPVDNGNLKYYQNFNVTTTGVYNAANFDLDYDGPSCPIMNDQMLNTSGAGQYYSNNNSNQNFQQAYVPDAEGYPFIRIEYTPDHTGRIRRKSGAGADFQLESGHETKYSYATPTQGELTNLFGDEVGDWNKYSKTLTEDGNGQTYVSYYDFHGRLIASGLVGAAPTGIDNLSNNTGASVYTTTIFEGTTGQDETFGSVELNSSFTVDVAGDVSFSYFLNPEVFQDACMTSVCFDCVYDLTLTITTVDDCGELVTVFDETHTVNGIPIDGICNEPDEYNLPSSALQATLNSGTYFLSKTLTVNEEAREDYLCLYLEDNSCLMSYQDFFNANFSQADFSDCQPETYSPPSPSTSNCEDYEEILLMDLFPNGQYGLFDNVNGVYNATAYPLSVFNVNNSLPIANANYTNPFTPYLDEDGTTPSLVNGVAPENLSLTDFILNFKQSWAKSLLPYHPEYAYLEFCNLNTASHNFNNTLNGTSLFSDACSNYYLDPLGNLVLNGSIYPQSLTFYDNCDESTNAIISDPFFQTGGQGAAYYNDMVYKMEHYATWYGEDLSIWELAILMAKCPDVASSGDIFLCLDRYTGAGDCLEDAIWLNFKNLYLTAKLEFYQLAELDYVMANGSYNGCISEATFDETINDFNCYPIVQTPACISGTSYNGYIDNNQACNSTTYVYYAGKNRIFPVYDPTNFQTLTPAQMTALQTQAEIEMNAECSDYCTQSANEWMTQLSGCNLTTTQYDNIEAELIELCILGCDFENPLGSSTTPTGVTTTNGNTSFDEVLAYHLGANYQSEICSDLLISDPNPYGQSGIDIFTATLDDCGCDMVLLANYEYNANPSSYSGIDEAFFAQNGFSVDGLNTLLCVCSSAFENEWTPGATWSATSLSNLAAEDLTVPVQLSCQTEDCYDCTQIATHVSTFHNLFTDGSPAAITSFENHPNYGTLLANYLNNTLAFDLGPFDYLEFLEKCNATSTDMYCTETPEMLSFVPVIDLLVKQDKLLTLSTSSINLVNENVPYQYTPFGMGMNSHNYWTDYNASTCTNGTLTMSFGEVGASCDITLTLPQGATFCFDDIISVNGITALSDNCGDNTSFLLDVVYIDCNGTQTATLEGTSGCYAVSECSCGPTGLQLCNEPLPTLSSYSDCYVYPIQIVTANAMDAYEAYMAEVKEQFRIDYTNKCMESFATEKLDMTGVKNEYQYTLYYYDQAGNLVRTVAPKGVQNGLSTGAITTNAGSVPDYTYDTDYRYNSYNQLTNSNTPDGGKVNYWYDQFGRIIASQNAEQLSIGSYAYSLYDKNGRIIEVGQTQQTANPLTETIAKGNNVFETWVLQGTRTEITKTYYDEPISATVSALFHNGEQTNLRLRIATVAYYETEVTDYLTQYTSAIHYAYDVHGNVIENIQDVPMMAPVNQDKKSTEYDYDLISGNVKQVTYQRDETDQFIHRYTYDALDRLQSSYSSSNNVDFDQESKQFYYDHGPLARVEIGEDKVQGLDYTYTINGWLKGVNSSTLTRANDLGLDGISTANLNYAGLHGGVAKDVIGYTLGYYEGDYTPINGSQTFEATTFSTPLGNAASNLYNGNIRYMTTAIEGFDIQATAYTYDQLQRFKKMEVYRGVDIVNNTWSTAAYTDDYKTTVTYDENGNIQSLNRNGIGTDLDMDRFSYIYSSSNDNKLYSVTDNGTDYSGYDDIKTGMGATNYAYDNIGRLTQDLSENIAVNGIEWRNSDNKVKKITRSTTAGDDLEFIYNPMGMRVVKIVKPDLAVPEDWEYTYYTYDAGGNVMATYTTTLNSLYRPTTLDEQYIYGGKRLGTKNAQIELYNHGVVTPPATDIISNYRGTKSYELSNHLGNVLAVVSDRTTYLGVQSGPTDTDYGYVAYIRSKSDYYPFGMQMPGRLFNDGSSYKYGFNGMEKDNEVSGGGNSYDFGARFYNNRLGKWFSTDFITKPFVSPYNFARNNPIIYIDPDGNDEIIFEIYWKGTGDNAILVMNTHIIQDGKDELTFRVVNGEIFDLEVFYNAIKETDEYKFNPFEEGTGIGNYQSYKAAEYNAMFVIGDQGFAVNDFTYLGILLKMDPTALKEYSDSKWNNSLNGAVTMAESESFASYVEYLEGAGIILNGVRKVGVKLITKSAVKTTTKVSTKKLNKVIRAYAKKYNVYSAQKKVFQGQVDKYYKQMKNNTFDMSSGGAGFYHNGKYIMTEGNHRMYAAIKYAIETGDTKYINSILKNSNIQNANPKAYGYKTYECPKLQK